MYPISYKRTNKQNQQAFQISLTQMIILHKYKFDNDIKNMYTSLWMKQGMQKVKQAFTKKWSKFPQHSEL